MPRWIDLQLEAYTSKVASFRATAKKSAAVSSIPACLLTVVPTAASTNRLTDRKISENSGAHIAMGIPAKLNASSGGMPNGIPDDPEMSFGIIASCPGFPLRNIAVTAPYMHDGGIATLEKLISHYAVRNRIYPNSVPLGTDHLHNQIAQTAR